MFDFRQINNYETYQKFVSKQKVKIGTGVQGAVYKVYINNALPFALKKIRLDDEIENCKQQIINFQKETDMLISINHPHIVKVYFRFLHHNSQKNITKVYIGMELVSFDLSKQIKQKNKFNEYEISQLAAQLLSALSYLEAHKIAHRDLKPSNILVSQEGTYKICDFCEYKWESKTLIARRNTLVETPNYLSPELKLFYLDYLSKIEREKQVSNQLIYCPFKSDVFSFGLILIECIVGDNIIRELNSNKNALQDILDKYCSPALRSFLSKCVAFDSNDRLFFNELNQFFQVNPIELIFQLTKKDEQIATLKTNLELLIEDTQKQNIEQQILKDQPVENIDAKKENQEQQILKNTNNQFYQCMEENQLLKSKIEEMKKWHLRMKSDEEIFKICLKNQDVWQNKNEDYRKNQFSTNTNLKWNAEHCYNTGHYDNTHFWKDSTGEKDYTYWRNKGFLFIKGKAQRVVEKDIPKAISIVKQLANETGYEFKNCLKILHSNLWHYEKSKNDLMY